VRYVSLHFLKESQAPPKGWRGHRTSQSRDYLVRPASVMREEAKRSQQVKRLLAKGVPAELLERELELAESIEWELVDVRRTPGGVIEPRQVVLRDRGANVVRSAGDGAQAGRDPTGVTPARDGPASEESAPLVAGCPGTARPWLVGLLLN
jgi:hypothetical protein